MVTTFSIYATELSFLVKRKNYCKLKRTQKKNTHGISLTGSTDIFIAFQNFSYQTQTKQNKRYETREKSDFDII